MVVKSPLSPQRESRVGLSQRSLDSLKLTSETCLDPSTNAEDFNEERGNSYSYSSQFVIDGREFPIPHCRFCLYICLSPPSLHLLLLSIHPHPLSTVPLWCYLRVCVSVGRRWRSVCLNPDKETNSSDMRERGKSVVGGGNTTRKT